MKNFYLSVSQTATLVFGPLFILLLFIISLIIVLGVKSFLSLFKDSPPKSELPKPVIKKPKKKIRTIKVDADDIDRIIVKHD